MCKKNLLVLQTSALQSFHIVLIQRVMTLYSLTLYGILTNDTVFISSGTKIEQKLVKIANFHRDLEQLLVRFKVKTKKKRFLRKISAIFGQ